MTTDEEYEPYLRSSRKQMECWNHAIVVQQENSMMVRLPPEVSIPRLTTIDSDSNPCSREDAYKVNIIEYAEDGSFIYELFMGIGEQ